ncbi:MAG: hypothetical protein O2903_03595 [Actinobacteria bacterium]|nr:hypothetical protein [Actinomycetota bacterium]MDA2981803.1 hypothetical protein [Actinomycetota bacterium]MDA2996680.1 hypothetical protein [Actinomycetota bacterium]
MGNPTPSLAEIGKRVSIRLHEPGGGFRDLLGTLEEIDIVRKKDGSLVQFDHNVVALWKVVPEK